MTTTLQPTCSRLTPCCYINHTAQIQVGRIADVPDWYFERVIFPGQRLLFEAPPHACLEIYTSSLATAMLAERIRCATLASSSSSAQGLTSQRELEPVN